MKTFLRALSLALLVSLAGTSVCPAASLPVYVVDITGSVITQPDQSVAAYSTAALSTKSILKKYATPSHPVGNLQLILVNGLVMPVDKTDGTAVGPAVIDLTDTANFVATELPDNKMKFIANGILRTPIGFDPSDTQLSADGGIAGSAVFTEIANSTQTKLESLVVKFVAGARGSGTPAYSRLYRGKLVLAGLYKGAALH